LTEPRWPGWCLDLAVPDSRAGRRCGRRRGGGDHRLAPAGWGLDLGPGLGAARGRRGDPHRATGRRLDGPAVERVVIVQDNDQAGLLRTQHLRKHLTPVAAMVDAITFPDMAAGYDVTDWLADGGTAELLLAQATPVLIDRSQASRAMK